MTDQNNGSQKTGLSKLLSLFVRKEKPPIETEKVFSSKSQQHNDVIWINVQNPSRSDLVKITEKYNLHSILIDQSLQKGQIAQMVVEPEYIFLVLHFPYLKVADNRIATTQVSVFLGKKYLITVHESPAPTISNLFDSFKDKPADATKSAGHILFRIIEDLLKGVESLTQNVSVELDDIEDKVFDDKDSDAFQIGQLRQKIMRLRRTLATQKNVLDELDAIIDSFSGERLERYYESNTNMSKKLWETVEEARETIEIYKDADFTTSTERTSEILAVLTLLFTLTIPATIIGTFYGMNILLPGGIEAGSWTFLGSFTVLKIVVALSFVTALLMYLNFKRKKWF